MSDLKIATRRSRLAMAQAQLIAEALVQVESNLKVELVEVTTTGDRDRSTPVTTLTEVGAFVRAVQLAVLEGSADIAVHSCKDLPVEGPSGLISFYPRREAPWDVMCGHDLSSLPPGARIGTGSPRRAAQIRRLRPDVEIGDIRGNVDTRLGKMHSGQYDAVILAEAGLRRLGRESEIDYRFSLSEMVPAPAQAALAVEVLVDNPAVEILEQVESPETRETVEAERSLLRFSRAGCRSALGAHAVVHEGGVRLTGFVQDEHGPRFAEAEGADSEQAARNLQGALAL